MSKPVYLLVLFLFVGCYSLSNKPTDKTIALTAVYDTTAAIPALSGYQRVPAAAGSFAAWLRNIKLKKDKQVYLYNGQLKKNQSAQFAVLDIPVGSKDLQQCADAVMRLRAEYLLSQGLIDQIVFYSSGPTALVFRDWQKGIRYKPQGNKLVPYQSATTGSDTRRDLENYLEFVFSYCGTYTLQAQLKKRTAITAIRPGDVFVKAGSPGHAMIVLDVLINDKGEKAFMLAQSYMPAQDIHIVVNPFREDSPWYLADTSRQLITPEWVFSAGDLYTWSEG